MANVPESQFGKSLSFIREASVGEDSPHLYTVSSSNHKSITTDQTWSHAKLHKSELPQVTPIDIQERNSGGKTVPAVKAKMAAAELSKRYPPMSLPKLHCFSSFLDDVSPDANKIIQEVEARLKKQEQRKTTVKKVRRMYHLSQANAATTRRIMEKSENGADFLTHCPDVSQVISAEYLGPVGRRIQLEPLDVDRVPTDTQQSGDSPQPPPTSIQQQQHGGSTAQCTRSNTATKWTLLSSSEQTNRQDLKSSSEYSAAPLSMDDLASRTKIVKANHRSNVWINYAN